MSIAQHHTGIPLATLLFLAAMAVQSIPAKETAPADGVDPTRGFSGKVVEIIKASRYIYVQVDTGSSKVWVASPGRPLETGDKVQVPGGMPMKDFVSPELGRTFDWVYFVGVIRREGDLPPAAKLPAGHPSSGKPGSLPGGHPPLAKAPGGPSGHPPAKPPTPLDFDGLTKAPDGKTVAEIFTEGKILNGANILLRGKVTKVNKKIMGKNWLHIQDGTGEPGSNDLVVTTQDSAAVGDTVLVKGTLRTNADFGFGYKFDLLLEEAKITVEKPDAK